MVFNEPGTYYITYTVFDDCGNRVEVEREVIASYGVLQNEDSIDLATENGEIIEAGDEGNADPVDIMELYIHPNGCLNSSMPNSTMDASEIYAHCENNYTDVGGSKIATNLIIHYNSTEQTLFKNEYTGAWVFYGDNDEYFFVYSDHIECGLEG